MTIRITISTEEVCRLAESYFIRYCGLDLEKEKHRRMYREATEVWTDGSQGIRIDALVAAAGAGSFQGHKVTVGKQELHCSAFRQIPDDSVREVYLYLITAGECRCSEGESITRRLYADIWGTACVDAGRDILHGRIQALADERARQDGDSNHFLSCCFGPGFYGMELEESIRLASILQGDSIGVRVLENGVMLPLKTCSGLYLDVDNPEKLPAADCMSCIGNRRSCDFCKIRKKA